MPETDRKDENAAIAETHGVMKKPRGYKTLAIALIVVLFFAISPFLAQFLANKYAAVRLNKALGEMKGLCYGIYEKAEYNIWSRHLLIYNASLICGEEEAARFGKLDFNHVVAGSPVPSNLSVEISEAVVNVDAEVFSRYGELASQLGFSAVPFRGKVAYTLGPSSKEFNLVTFIINAEGVGVINAEAKVPSVRGASVSEVFREIWENKPAELWLSFKDEGFAEVVIARYAASLDTDPISAKERALKGLDKRIAGKYKNIPAGRERLVQIYRFIETPSEIIIKADKNYDVSLKNIAESLDYSGWRALAESAASFQADIFSN